MPSSGPSAVVDDKLRHSHATLGDKVASLREVSATRFLGRHNITDAAAHQKPILTLVVMMVLPTMLTVLWRIALRCNSLASGERDSAACASHIRYGAFAALKPGRCIVKPQASSTAVELPLPAKERLLSIGPMYSDAAREETLVKDVETDRSPA